MSEQICRKCGHVSGCRSPWEAALGQAGRAAVLLFPALLALLFGYGTLTYLETLFQDGWSWGDAFQFAMGVVWTLCFAGGFVTFIVERRGEPALSVGPQCPACGNFQTCALNTPLGVEMMKRFETETQAHKTRCICP